jgi:hypothetical protein
MGDPVGKTSEWILIVVGALMVNRHSAWLRRMLEKFRVRSPVLARAFKRFSAWGETRQSRYESNPADSGSPFGV